MFRGIWTVCGEIRRKEREQELRKRYTRMRKIHKIRNKCEIRENARKIRSFCTSADFHVFFTYFHVRFHTLTLQNVRDFAKTYATIRGNAQKNTWDRAKMCENSTIEYARNYKNTRKYVETMQNPKKCTKSTHKITANTLKVVLEKRRYWKNAKC